MQKCGGGLGTDMVYDRQEGTKEKKNEAGSSKGDDNMLKIDCRLVQIKFKDDELLILASSQHQYVALKKIVYIQLKDQLQIEKWLDWLKKKEKKRWKSMGTYK
ncbi:hypothetical protein DFH29DRAFT_880481 [Suillus ampliporus]|nr:hypothetical protein DFH29DRAFT_880481 [Suillus ampliporus]